MLAQITGEISPINCAESCEIFAYRSADKSLARPGRKQVTATEEFDVHISYL